MTEPVGLKPARLVRIVFWALLAAPVLIALVMLYVLGGRQVIAALAGPPGYALYAVCAAGFAFGSWWRARIPRKGSQGDEDAYWRGALPRMLSLYALLEGVAVLGVLVALLAGTRVVGLVILLLYMTQMMAYAPGRLAGD